jgi:hypothetical protein
MDEQFNKILSRYLIEGESPRIKENIYAKWGDQSAPRGKIVIPEREMYSITKRALLVLAFYAAWITIIILKSQGLI